MRNFSESELLRLFFYRAKKDVPECRLFRRNVGAAKFGGRWVRFGIAGQGDVYGVIRGEPARLVEIECKAMNGKMRKEQEEWRDWCRSWGVSHLELKPKEGESAFQTVVRWVEMLKAVVEGEPSHD